MAPSLIFQSDAGLLKRMDEHRELVTRNVGWGIDRLRVVAVEKGRIVCELKVGQDQVNFMGAFHGAVVMALVDIVSSLAIASFGVGYEVHTSTDVHTSFVKGGKLNDIVHIVGTCSRPGKSVSFTQCELWVAGDVIARGSHTKFMLSNPPGGAEELLAMKNKPRAPKAAKI